MAMAKAAEASPPTPNGEIDNPDMSPLEAVETNNIRPACFTSTLQEVLFVLTATMAIAMQA
ncbi:hypothetical protein LTS01_026064, partial [Friedmanniomyces endolithicus]